jgi:hypothetical protein
MSLHEEFDESFMWSYLGFECESSAAQYKTHNDSVGEEIVYEERISLHDSLRLDFD